MSDTKQEEKRGSEKKGEKKAWTEEELKDCFYLFDSDGNGYIDKDELVTACQMLGCDDQQAEKMAEDIRKACDENKDNKITWDEFKNNIARVI